LAIQLNEFANKAGRRPFLEDEVEWRHIHDKLAKVFTGVLWQWKRFEDESNCIAAGATTFAEGSELALQI